MFSKKKSDEKNSDEKIPTKKFRTKKNWGQGTGARHGRCGAKARVTEIPEEGFAPPDPLTEFPEGGEALPDSPTTTFQKICPPGKFFEMIETGGAPAPQTPPTGQKNFGVGRGAAPQKLWQQESWPQRRTGVASTEISATEIMNPH